MHSEYRRHLLKVGELSDDSHIEFAEYGISETEGSSLLGEDESSWETRRSCLEWCTEHNIEYIEACASNADFDKCKAFTLPCPAFRCSQLWLNQVRCLVKKTEEYAYSDYIQNFDVL